MIAGHFGLAAAVKSRETTTPLWALMLATAWLDIVFVPLFAAGIETTQEANHAQSGYGALIIHANYTHSLVGAVILSAVLGVFFGLFWGRRAGIVIGLVAASHWFLDLFVHRADLPILPGNLGNLTTFGFGLWRHPSVAAVIELVLVLGGAWLYWRSANDVATIASKGKRAAAISAALIAIFGLLVLWLDFTSA